MKFLRGDDPTDRIDWSVSSVQFTGRLYRVIGTSDTNGGRAKMFVGIDFYRELFSR